MKTLTKIVFHFLRRDPFFGLEFRQLFLLENTLFMNIFTKKDITYKVINFHLTKLIGTRKAKGLLSTYMEGFL